MREVCRGRAATAKRRVTANLHDGVVHSGQHDIALNGRASSTDAQKQGGARRRRLKQSNVEFSYTCVRRRRLNQPNPTSPVARRTRVAGSGIPGGGGVIPPVWSTVFLRREILTEQNGEGSS